MSGERVVRRRVARWSAAITVAVAAATATPAGAAAGDGGRVVATGAFTAFDLSGDRLLLVRPGGAHDSIEIRDLGTGKVIAVAGSHQKVRGARFVDGGRGVLYDARPRGGGSAALIWRSLPAGAEHVVARGVTLRELAPAGRYALVESRTGSAAGSLAVLDTKSSRTRPLALPPATTVAGFGGDGASVLVSGAADETGPWSLFSRASGTTVPVGPGGSTARFSGLSGDGRSTTVRCGTSLYTYSLSTHGYRRITATLPGATRRVAFASDARSVLVLSGPTTAGATEARSTLRRYPVPAGPSVATPPGCAPPVRLTEVVTPGAVPTLTATASPSATATATPSAGPTPPTPTPAANAPSPDPTPTPTTAVTGRPIVTATYPARYFEDTMYVVSGDVDPNGLDTKVTVEFTGGSRGEPYGFDRTESGIDAAAGSIAHPYFIVTALLVGGTYTYRLKATNAAGTTYGPEETFVAAGIPWIWEAKRPTASLTGTGAPTWTFHAQVALFGHPAVVTVEYGPTPALGTTSSPVTVQPSSPSSLASKDMATVTIPGVKQGQTIYYQYVATSAVAQGTSLGQYTFTPPTGLVRSLYLYPTDRPYRPRYSALVSDALGTVQRFYQDQVGKTFSLDDDAPIACALPHSSAYYGAETQDQNGTWVGAWTKLSAAIKNCAGYVQRSDYDWVVYADITDVSCHDRIGAGGANITFVGDTDLEGLDGQTGFTSPCSPAPDSRTGPWGYTGGIAHEIGHTFGLDHPDVVNCGDRCALNGSSLMYLGYLDLRTTYLLGSDKTKLLASPFFS